MQKCFVRFCCREWRYRIFIQTTLFLHPVTTFLLPAFDFASCLLATKKHVTGCKNMLRVTKCNTGDTSYYFQEMFSVLETMTVHFSEAHDPTVIVRSAKINEWKLAYKDINREILLDLVASCLLLIVIFSISQNFNFCGI